MRPIYSLSAKSEVRRKSLLFHVACVASAVCLSTSSMASELIYSPQNPSFGGNIANGSYLLGIANAQKQFERERDENTPLEDFNDRLQRSLLSRITSAVTRDIVDIDGNITPGTFETVDYLIEIVDEGDGFLTIITTDRVSGESTRIQVRNEN
ncbi:MAG: curli assembly protein CsgF [Granulosicoccus sp.]